MCFVLESPILSAYIGEQTQSLQTGFLTDEGKAGVDQECTECAPALSAWLVLRLQVA